MKSYFGPVVVLHECLFLIVATSSIIVWECLHPLKAERKIRQGSATNLSIAYAPLGQMVSLAELQDL